MTTDYDYASRHVRVIRANDWHGCKRPQTGLLRILLGWLGLDHPTVSFLTSTKFACCDSDRLSKNRKICDKTYISPTL